MISFFSFYSSPKHITKRKIILSFVQVHIQWDLLRAVFIIIPLDFINVLWPLVILQWADGSLKLENSSLKNLYSHTAETPETDFTYSIFGVHLTAWNQREEPQLHLWNCSIAHNRNLHLQSWIWTPPAEEKEQGDQWLTVNPQSDRHAHSSTVWIHNKLQLFLFQSGCLILWLCI